MGKTEARLIVVAALVTCCPPFSWAQTAQVSGRVTDPTGSVVLEANVTVLNVDTGIKRGAASNAEGYYIIPLLPPGNYQMTVQKTSFRPISRSGIKLLADDRVRIDFALELGSLAEAITVQADAPMLMVDSAESGKSVSGREYDRLPLIQVARLRNPSTFVYLAPGTHGNIEPTGRERTSDTNQIIVHGSQILNTEQLIDGSRRGKRDIWGT